MALKIEDLGELRLPQMPETVAVFELSPPSLGSRRAGIARLTDALQLGSLRSVELDHGVMLAGKRGEIEYFGASGAVWARDATSAAAHKDEFRQWDDVKTDDQGTPRVALGDDSSKRLLAQADELLQATGLVAREAIADATVALDQVAVLDEEGRETGFGAGQATVKLSYSVDGLPVHGPGAKSLVFAEPENGSARITGAFHVWRNLRSAQTVTLPPVEGALAVGLLVDPELEHYGKAGHAITITRLDFGYLALPAFMRQSHLIPAFQVEGEVSEGERGAGFRFGRYHHCVPAKAYAAADLHGLHLTTNPDGIAPAARNSNR